MPEAPRRTTQDTWIPNGPDAPAPGPASADPGHEAATLDHKTEAGRRAEPSAGRGGTDSTAGFGETDAARRGGTEAASAVGGTDTARGSGRGSAGTESPLGAAHPQTGDRTFAGTPGTADRTSAAPGPDGTGTHTPGPAGTGTRTPGPDGTGTGTHVSGLEGTGTHAPGPDGTGTRTPGAHAATPGQGGTSGHPGSRLLADDTCDRLSAQLRQAVAGFVDRPRDAVEEADLVLHEITERLNDALTERRHTLTRNWKAPAPGDPKKGDAAPAADTEQLRLALRDYRELAERLLGV
ncbi:hypothetical protein NC658_06055 [Streptomyces griseoincarnatus]|uniref:Uncharacterized protein n=1 Tax=Streptomyces griseoincarnatus TaxID=29305 RepID=A0ABT0VPD4_STRGI|nr:MULTISPECIES: hypothetical protein [Streptomyces]MBJ6616813.1 hypothetical protein [Streptomyces sp. I3(2020)]MBJ6628554.1 hypothetical protein [Streptomyces sp. I4(2020)]MCM2512825.1 hypothetical protein [Streptomyces griseoincarnatus]